LPFSILVDLLMPDSVRPEQDVPSSIWAVPEGVMSTSALSYFLSEQPAVGMFAPHFQIFAHCVLPVLKPSLLNPHCDRFSSPFRRAKSKENNESTIFYSEIL